MGRGPGIRVVGKDSIQIDFRWRGERHRERLRLAPTKANLQFAKRLKTVIEHEIAVGTFDFAKHFPRSRRARVSIGVPLRSALVSYVESLAADLEPETVRKYRLDAITVSNWFGADTTIESLTRARVREAIAELKLSKKRILNLLTPLRGAIAQAVDDGDLASNPLAALKIRRTRKTDAERPRPFTPAEIGKLAAQPLGDLWHIWAWLGLRPGEVIGLQVADVDLIAGRVHIRRAVRLGREKAPKTAAGERHVTILPAVRNVVARAVHGISGAIFRNPNTGERWHEDRALARAFRIDCKAAGVPYRPPKQLRHTYASWALSAGENPMWVARQMGHENTAMVFKVYAKWIPELDGSAGARMAAKAG